MNYSQKTFNGGMDTLSPDTQVKEDSYVQLINGRTRFGGVRPVKKHVEVTGLTGYNYQGCVGVGDSLVVFVDGLAYRQKEGSDEWTRITGFALSPTAEEVYTEAVPASYLGFVRKANANIHADINLVDDFKISGTPACIICQDGISQPWYIAYNIANQEITTDRLRKFYEWENVATDTADRQYVPIGREMLYTNGILFIVAPNRDKIYRSITGRPIDFMINVDTNGNKKVDELTGGAETVAFAFDFDEITCIKKVNTPNSFVVGTRRNIYVVTLDYNLTIFGEPTFYISATIEAGIVNNKSFLELTGIGDYAFIDYEGVIAFNAVEQLQTNGRNSIFSLALSKLLNGVKQRSPACVNFDNYSLFSLRTNYGYLMAVYDLLLQKWVSFDITELARIKQFAQTETVNASYLYCVTEDNKLYKMYSSSSTYPCQLRTRSFVHEETSVEHKAQNFRCMFNGGTADGEVTLIEMVDERESVVGSLNRLTKELPISVAGIKYPVKPPVIPNTLSRVDNPTFITSMGHRGKKLAYILIWDNDAELVEFQLTTTDIKSTVSAKENNSILTNAYGS